VPNEGAVEFQTTSLERKFARWIQGGNSGRLAQVSAQAKIVQMQSGKQSSAMYEKHFRPAEVARFLGVSEKTAYRLFEPVPGVLKLENPVRSSSRRYRTMLIPQSVYERWYSQQAGKGA